MLNLSMFHNNKSLWLGQKLGLTKVLNCIVQHKHVLTQWHAAEELVWDSALTTATMTIDQHWVWYWGGWLPSGSLTQMTNLSEGVIVPPIPVPRATNTTEIHPITTQKLKLKKLKKTPSLSLSTKYCCSVNVFPHKAIIQKRHWCLV